MVDPIKLLIATSFCSWLIILLVFIFLVKHFIVKRYEVETELLKTVYFREHATFTRALPDFFSSAMYSGHLAMCCWGWKIYGHKNVFRDIVDPIEITKCFSKQEIRRVQWLLISGVVVIIHAVSFFIFRFSMPESFRL
jgi:hypothetical protein